MERREFFRYVGAGSVCFLAGLFGVRRRIARRRTRRRVRQTIRAEKGGRIVRVGD